MSFYVYILQCVDGSYYVGHTDNLEQRVAAHRQGTYSGYTARRQPIKLVFAADFPSREEAFQRERQIKGWTRQKKEALIEESWAQLATLAQSSAKKVRFPARGSTGSP